MAVLSHTMGYLYLMAPRTACTATGDVLCKKVRGWWLPEGDIEDRDGNIIIQRKHATVEDLVGHGLLDEHEVDELFVFVAVRNPFDSLVSLWVKKTTSYQPLLDDPDSFVNKLPGFADDMRWMLDHSFPEWIERQYADKVDAPRHLYSGHLDRADFVMRFEDLQADFEEALSHVGVDDPPQIPLINVTEERDGDYRDYYDDSARTIVERVFAPDLDRFGYEF